MTMRNSIVVSVFLALTSLHLGAQQQPSPVSGQQLPGTSKEAASSAVKGQALSSSDHPLANTLVRLRDARFGTIVAQQTSDEAGLFTFSNIEPGNYIVEMIGADQTIIATSQVLTVGAGETVSAVVTLPLKILGFAGVLKHPPSVLSLVSQAAVSAIVAKTPSGDPTCNIGQAKP